MKVLDANVLIYSVDADCAHHEAARRWIDTALSGAEPIVMPWLCLVAFVRITTHPRLYEHPLAASQALDAVDRWLGSPATRTDVPAAGLAGRLRQALEATGVGGNTVNDAWLAALAVSLDAELVSFDTDFARFPSLTWVNPAASG
ncbi:MAG: PIN domain-containing protein [Actinomycetia bacterium]|nr:PIN domain-containing protein [Actinomycetes bacterium]